VSAVRASAMKYNMMTAGRNRNRNVIESNDISLAGIKIS
jgi:hypothetical protein